MSAPSGIKVSDHVKSAFTSAQTDASDVRAMVFVIQGESFTHHTTVKPKSSFKDDIALLPDALPSPKTPASIAYRLDTKEKAKHEWMMVTFVPDDAGVRAKMLQASSRAGLLKALGENNFKHDWFATSISDLTPSALTAHLNHLASPPPLSAAEAALAEVREAEAAEAKRAALDPEAEARRKKAVVGLGGKLNWGDGVAEALQRCAERSDGGWIVCLEIPAANPGSIALLKSEACSPSAVASKLPAKSPCYTFYSYRTPAPAPAPAPPTPSAKVPSSEPRNTFQASEGGARSVTTSWAPKTDSQTEPETPAELEKEDSATPSVTDLSLQETETSSSAQQSSTAGSRVIFIYTCPSASPVKFRMVYSSGVRSIQQDAKDKVGMEIAAKLETSDISDLTESYLKSSLPSKPTHSSSLPMPAGAFGRPRPTPSLKTVRSATQIPLPASPGPTSPLSATPGDQQGADTVMRAFNAFGPRVNASSGDGFARPRPAGKR